MVKDQEIPRDADKWWDEYERLRFSEERRLALVNATLDLEAPEDFWDRIDIFDAVSNAFYHIASTEGAREGAKFLEKFRSRKPRLYERSFH